MRELFAQLFEFFNSFQSAASSALYRYVYTGAGGLMILLTALLAGIFYFLLFRSQARWDTLRHWLIWLLLTAVLVTIIIALYTAGTFNRNELEYGVDSYLEFLISVLFWSGVFFFLFSLVFKRWGHPSRRRLPF